VEGTLWLEPFVAYVTVRAMTVDRQWRALAEIALVGCVFGCIVALTADAARAAAGP
jgi:hypothetical protein